MAWNLAYIVGALVLSGLTSWRIAQRYRSTVRLRWRLVAVGVGLGSVALSYLPSLIVLGAIGFGLGAMAPTTIAVVVAGLSVTIGCALVAALVAWGSLSLATKLGAGNLATMP